MSKPTRISQLEVAEISRLLERLNAIHEEADANDDSIYMHAGTITLVDAAGDVLGDIEKIEEGPFYYVPLTE